MIRLRHAVLAPIALLALCLPLMGALASQQKELRRDREYMGHVTAFLLEPPKTPCWNLYERIWMLEVLQPAESITARDVVMLEAESCALEGWIVVKDDPSPPEPNHPPAFAPAVREL